EAIEHARHVRRRPCAIPLLGELVRNPARREVEPEPDVDPDERTAWSSWRAPLVLSGSGTLLVEAVKEDAVGGLDQARGRPQRGQERVAARIAHDEDTDTIHDPPGEPEAGALGERSR